VLSRYSEPDSGPLGAALRCAERRGILGADGAQRGAGLSRVFVVQNNGRYSFKKAERYGNLVSLIERDVFPDDAQERVATIQNIMKAKLVSFNPAKDFLLLVGDPVAIAVAVLVLSCYTLQFNCLKYDRENKEYYEVRLEI